MEAKYERWTAEKANNWAKNRRWTVGFNYVASNCVNRMEQWQAYEHEQKIPVFEREFALAEEVGFNAIRSVLPLEPWLYEHDGFMRRLDNFLTLANRHGLGVMIVFGNDCCVPKSQWQPAKFGPQPVDWGYHGGVIRSPHAGNPEMGYSLLDDPELRQAWTKMVDEIVGEYAHDERVDIWDIFNEPGNSRRGMTSAGAMADFFDAARKHDPVQPLTAGVWTVNRTNTLPEIEQLAMELSDVISYHDYGSFDHSVGVIERLRKLGRPLFNTEWLNRTLHNNVATHLPLYYLENVGVYNWGFVAGKSQTYEPWDSLWNNYAKNPAADYDFTVWQHDLFRPSLRPYDPHEIETFRKYIAMSRE